MNRMKNIFPKITVREMPSQDGFPRLVRVYNRRQIFEMIMGLALLMVRGIGIILLAVSLLDFYFFTYTCTVRNMKDGKTYLMDKSEWSKYRKLAKEQKSKD